MRVAIDARPALDATRTGVGHYADRLIRALPGVEPDVTWVAWYLHARGIFRPRRFFPDVDAPNFREHASRFPARLYQPVSWRLGVPRLEWLVDLDAVLATNFLPPPTRKPAVLVVHDLAFERFPETAPHVDHRWRARLRDGIRGAAAVIVPSEATRADVLDAYRVDGANVVVVPHGVDTPVPVSPDAAFGVARRFGIGGEYLIFVGGIEPRKNLGALVRSFARVPGEAWLVVAGGPVRWIPQEAALLQRQVNALPAGARRRVVLTGYVAGKDKAALLAGARGLAYPSMYEGFGLPVLEAMAAGVPVLASNVSSLPEVAGDAAILVDPNSEEEIAEGLTSLLVDPDLRARLRDAGLARAATFTWERTARATADVIRGSVAG